MRLIFLVFLFCVLSVSFMVLFAQTNQDLEIDDFAIDDFTIDPTGQVAPLEKENYFSAFFKRTRLSVGFHFAHSLGPIAFSVPISLGAGFNWDFTLNRGKTSIWRNLYSFEQIGIGEGSNSSFLQVHTFLFGPSYSFSNLSKGWGSIYIAALPGVSVYLFHRERLKTGLDITFTLRGIIGYELNLDKVTEKDGLFLFFYLTTTYLFDKVNLYLNVGFQVGVGYNFGKSYRKLL